MYLRAIGRHFTQMNAYFLVMNSKMCITLCVRKVLTFCVEYFITFASMLLHFALVLHLAA